MQHVQFKHSEDHEFDHLNANKDQQLKAGYDTVPPPVLKPLSLPPSDEHQEEYTESINEDVLKVIKQQYQTYARLSKDQSHDRIPGPFPLDANQPPPKLPAKKKSLPI